MKPISIFLLLLLTISSCKKEEIKSVTVSGKVINVNGQSPEQGITVSLMRSESLNGDGRSQAIMGRGVTDANGNYSISAEISDAFNYTVLIEDATDVLWEYKPEWGIPDLSQEMTYADFISTVNFSISKKATMDLDFTFSNPVDTSDVLLIRLIRGDGTSYWFSSIGNPGPDPNTTFDFSDYLLGSTFTLMDGPQSLECYFTNGGNDTTFFQTYTLVSGQNTTVTVEL